MSAMLKGADFIVKCKTEAFDLWQYLCGEVFEPLIRCRMDFDGFIDEDILKNAVTQSLKTIPMIGLCFDGIKHKPRWIDKGFNGNDIVRVVKTDSKDDEQVVLRCLSAGIDFADEPQLKLFVVRKPDHDTICSVISHIVCDGAGFKQYLYLLSKLYTQLINRETVSAPAISYRGLKPLFADISLKERLKILCSKYSAYNASNKTQQRGVDFKEGAFVTAMERRILSAEDFDRLKIFAKANGATVNDIFMGLFARSFCKNTGTDKIMFPSTMDLRKFIPTGQEVGIGNYSSNCMCAVFVKREDTLADTVMQVSKQMRVHKSEKNILKSVMLWDFAAHIPWFLLKRNFSKVITHPIISFTNLGIIDAIALKFGKLKIRDVYMTASIKPRPYLQMNVSTFNDSCTLSCNIYGSKADEQFVHRLLDDMCLETITL